MDTIARFFHNLSYSKPTLGEQMLSAIRRSFNCLPARMPYSMGVTAARTVAPAIRNRICVNTILGGHTDRGYTTDTQNCLCTRFTKTRKSTFYFYAAGITLVGLLGLGIKDYYDPAKQLHRALDPKSPNFELAAKLIESGVDAEGELKRTIDQLPIDMSTLDRNTWKVILFLLEKVPFSSQILVDAILNERNAIVERLLSYHYHARSNRANPGRELLDVFTSVVARDKEAISISHALDQLIREIEKGYSRKKNSNNDDILTIALKSKRLNLIEKVSNMSSIGVGELYNVILTETNRGACLGMYVDMCENYVRVKEMTLGDDASYMNKKEYTRENLEKYKDKYNLKLRIIIILLKAYLEHVDSGISVWTYVKDPIPAFNKADYHKKDYHRLLMETTRDRLIRRFERHQNCHQKQACTIASE